MSDWDNYSENLAFDPANSMPRSDIEELKAKVAHLEKMRDITAEYVYKLEEKLRIVDEVLDDVETWFLGMVGTLNNECAEQNKSIPVGKFERTFKAYAYSLADLREKIEE